MSRRPLSRFVPHITGAAIGVTLVAAILPLPKLLLWNASASAPIGLYRINYLPVGVPLLKRVAARPGALICRRGATVTIEGRTVAIAHASDSHGRPLPVWRGCRVLRADELFLLNAVPDSLDGRYFGPIPASGLIGRAAPFLTRDTPDAPLRWHSGCAQGAPLTSKEGDILCR